MAIFKVGDMIECVNKRCNTASCLVIGRLYKVTRVKGHDIELDNPDSRHSGWWTDSQFQLATLENK